MTDYMYEDVFARSLLLYGAERVDKLRRSQVIICGLGGVGSYVAEALARSGVGALTLVDFDTVALSNINRQLPALTSTIGRPKVEVVAERIQTINLDCRLHLERQFIEEGNTDFLGHPDYLVDAIDHLPGKIALVCYAKEQKIPIACAMGAGLRWAPEQLRIADLSATHGCPLARKLRKALRERGITAGIPVVFSEEPPQALQTAAEPDEDNGKRPLGSSAFVPAGAGLLLASIVVRDLCGIER